LTPARAASFGSAEPLAASPLPSAPASEEAKQFKAILTIERGPFVEIINRRKKTEWRKNSTYWQALWMRLAVRVSNETIHSSK
jgi:hypothetical protein